MSYVIVMNIWMLCLALLLAYKAVMHVGGLAKGSNGLEMWQNCPLAC